MRPRFLLTMLALGALVVFALIFIPAKVRITRATDPRPTITAEVAPGVQQTPQVETNLDEKLRGAQSSTNARAKVGASHSGEAEAVARQEQHEARVAAR